MTPKTDYDGTQEIEGFKTSRPKQTNSKST